MSRLMIIGCGGVASVAIHKCCQNSEVFDEIMIASRTVSKCDALKEKLQPTTKTKITTAQVDADHVEELTALIRSYAPDAVLNVALPYQDLTIMDHVWRQEYIISIRQTMKQRIRMTRNGARCMKKGANAGLHGTL